VIDYDMEGLKYESLEKGDYISIDVLRKITGFDPGENLDLYRLACLKIREKIWDQCEFFTQGDGHAIRILKDAEAVYYKKKRFHQGQKIQKKFYERGLRIDESQLDAETREAYRRSNNHESRLLTAQESEYKRIRCEEKKEERPGPPLEKDIKVYSTGKDKTDDGNSTTENQIDGGSVTDPA
jgi:hypothetical protein